MGAWSPFPVVEKPFTPVKESNMKFLSRRGNYVTIAQRRHMIWREVVKVFLIHPRRVCTETRLAQVQTCIEVLAFIFELGFKACAILVCWVYLFGVARVVSSSVVGHQASFQSRDSHGNAPATPVSHTCTRTTITFHKKRKNSLSTR